MKEPVLVVMAAGMGSRYGGLKQIDPIGSEGELIIDFSLYDAMKAGFKKVVFIIKEEMEEDFKEIIGNRIEKYMDVTYAYQKIEDLPCGYEVPKERVKPWGTGHAIMAIKDKVTGPFAAINADDYYGKQAFSLIYDFLKNTQDDEKYHYAMVGYQLENTLTDHGYVARGVCQTDLSHYLCDIDEKTHIERRNGSIAYTEDGKTWTEISGETTVSMNMWGFTSSILGELEKGFEAFLKEGLINNPLKCEYFLPNVVGRLVIEDKATVSVLESNDKWYGVTYKEDKDKVVEAVANFKAEGIYPIHLWESKV